ncbi:MAG: hypothetical protein ACREPQ_09710 [Rhodanobacter sp.]
MTEPLTRPENYVEETITKRLVATVMRCGGCPVCKNRVEGWQRSACDTPGRTYPLCMKTPGAHFDPDHDKLRGNHDATHG